MIFLASAPHERSFASVEQGDQCHVEKIAKLADQERLIVKARIAQPASSAGRGAFVP